MALSEPVTRPRPNPNDWCGFATFGNGIYGYATNAVTGTADTWTTWVTLATTASTAVTTTNTWTVWATGATGGTPTPGGNYYDEASWQRRQQERVEARRAALDLFRSTLTPEQRRTHEEAECIWLTTPGGRRMRIWTRPGVVHGNVDELDPTDAVVARYCAAPQYGQLPDADCWLGQKLALETDEAVFFAAANRYPGVQQQAAA